MVAARTIPDTQKRRQCIVIRMSNNARSSPRTLCGGAQEPQGQQRISIRNRFLRVPQFREFALAHDSRTELSESAKLSLIALGGFHSHLTFARTACRHPTWISRPSPWLLDAGRCAV